MKHLTIKQTIVILFAVFIFAAFAAGCSEDIPDTTSEEAGLYLYGDSVVGKDGQKLVENGRELYEFASNGDIVSTEDGKIVVVAYNVEDFSCISKAEVEDEEQLETEIHVVRLGGGQTAYEPETLKIQIAVNDSDVVSKHVLVKSTDVNRVCFGNKAESTMSEADKSGKAEVEITACYNGKTELIICNCLGERIGAFTVNVTEIQERDSAKIADIKDKVNNCKHVFSDVEIGNAENSGSSRIHICSKCGLVTDSESYDTDSCSHSYVTRVIAPTRTSRGYTLHTCTLCGNSYKDKYTNMLTDSSTANKPATTSPAETPKPVETSKIEESPSPEPKTDTNKTHVETDEVVTD